MKWKIDHLKKEKQIKVEIIKLEIIKDMTLILISNLMNNNKILKKNNLFKDFNVRKKLDF